MKNILICDDEQDIINALKIYLEDSDYRFFEARNGREALAFFEAGEPELHLVLLDIMMPEMDGISAMSQIRRSSNVPIILLTAKSEDTDKVLGLDLGADDYITKPFNPLEVKARVRSQLRRYMKLGEHRAAVEEEADEQEESRGYFAIGGLELDDAEKSVLVDGDPISLTPTEFDILKLFMENPGRVFSPKDIYKKVWGSDPLGGENTVAVHIRHLREKIEINPAEPRYLKVVWGQGYKIDKNYSGKEA